MSLNGSNYFHLLFCSTVHRERRREWRKRAIEKLIYFFYFESCRADKLYPETLGLFHLLYNFGTVYKVLPNCTFFTEWLIYVTLL